MKIYKKVLSHDSGLWLTCCWDTCDRPGYELYKCIEHPGKRDAVAYVFCSERHRQYFLHSHRSFGRLPAGMRSVT